MQQGGFRVISADTKQAVYATVAQCDSLRNAARALCIHHAVLADILKDRHGHVSRDSENRVRAVLGLAPLPAPVPVDPCPDCGSVHHARCNGNSGPVVVLAATERVVKAGGGRKRRKLVRPVADETQNSRRIALGAGWREIIEAGLSALEGRGG